jgi:hypothetical protein
LAYQEQKLLLEEELKTLQILEAKDKEMAREIHMKKNKEIIFLVQ